MAYLIDIGIVFPCCFEHLNQSCSSTAPPGPLDIVLASLRVETDVDATFRSFEGIGRGGRRTETSS